MFPTTKLYILHRFSPYWLGESLARFEDLKQRYEVVEVGMKPLQLSIPHRSRPCCVLKSLWQNDLTNIYWRDGRNLMLEEKIRRNFCFDLMTLSWVAWRRETGHMCCHNFLLMNGRLMSQISIWLSQHALPCKRGLPVLALHF